MADVLKDALVKDAEVAVVATDSLEEESNRSDESVTEDAPGELPEADKETDPTAGSKKDKSESPAPAGGGKEATAKEVYTPEELEELLQSGTDVDTSRLSAEGRLLMKSFQRGYDKKFQQVAEMRKAAEAQRPPNPREELFSRYMRDPAGVTAEVNTEIEKLEGVDPTSAEYSKARVTIARLQALKDDFSVRRQGVIDHGSQVDTIVAKTETEILKAIPDFETKAPKLTEFAQELGFSVEEVRALTDPTIVGPLALKMTKAINAAYDKLHAPQSAEKKVKKDAPAPLQRGGGGSSSGKKTDDDPGSLPMSEYMERRKKFAE